MVRQLLADWPKDFVEEVCDLVARHHTYTGVDRLTLRILMEADFLVNAYEEGLSEEAVQAGKAVHHCDGKALVANALCSIR